ncbi:MAG: lipoyl(octanoyl) transferase LipB [Candidatus Omnitrophica bacterium]|nr:lipoyl(octanoyl) transferase LipB [Candidatus Omnitrophota bacterium]
MNIACETIDLGEIEYAEALDVQKRYVNRVISGEPHKLIFCQHPKVITIGRMSKKEHLFYSEEEYAQKGFTVYSVDRGGDVTLHAPGQQIIYPIFHLSQLHLKDLHRYIRKLEAVMIDTLRQFDIDGRRHETNTGVWVHEEKIISMGIGVRKWVSFHGIGLNVSTDLKLFSDIKPCGLDVQMTSIEKITKKTVDYKQLKDTIMDGFSKQFSFTIRNAQYV